VGAGGTPCLNFTGSDPSLSVHFAITGYHRSRKMLDPRADERGDGTIDSTRPGRSDSRAECRFSPVKAAPLCLFAGAPPRSACTLLGYL